MAQLVVPADITKQTPFNTVGEQNFDELLRVVKEAETTFSPDTPSPKKGKTQDACINQRRVEILSGAMKLLKKLLKEGHASPTAAAAAGARESKEEAGAIWDGLQTAVDQEETSALLAAGTAEAATVTSSVATGSDSRDAGPPNTWYAGDAAKPNKPSDPDEHKTPEQGTAAWAEAGAATALHHMVFPGSSDHAAMVPPGFVGFLGKGIPPAPDGMQGHVAQPIFVAVPMYVPQGQVMPKASAVEYAGQVSVSSNPPTAAALTGVTHSVPTVGATVAEKRAPPGTEVRMAYQPMMTLQMPHFVTQRISSKGNDKSSRAACA